MILEINLSYIQLIIYRTLWTISSNLYVEKKYIKLLQRKISADFTMLQLNAGLKYAIMTVLKVFIQVGFNLKRNIGSIRVVSIGLFWFCFMSFSYNGVYSIQVFLDFTLVQCQRRTLSFLKWLTGSEDRLKMYLCPNMYFFAQRERVKYLTWLPLN